MFLLFLVGIWAWEGRPLGRGRGPDGPRPALLVRLISSPLPLPPWLFLNFTRREYLYFRSLFCLFDFIASARPQCCGRSARGKGRLDLGAVFVFFPFGLICIEHQRWATANLRVSPRPGQRQNGKPLRVRLSRVDTHARGEARGAGCLFLFCCRCVCVFCTLRGTPIRCCLGHRMG